MIDMEEAQTWFWQSLSLSLSRGSAFLPIFHLHHRCAVCNICYIAPCDNEPPKRIFLTPTRPLNTESCHDAHFVVTGAKTCHNDNMWWHYRRQSWHHDNSLFSMPPQFKPTTQWILRYLTVYIFPVYTLYLVKYTHGVLCFWWYQLLMIHVIYLPIFFGLPWTWVIHMVAHIKQHWRIRVQSVDSFPHQNITKH